MKINAIRCDGCDREVQANDGAARYWAKLTLDQSTHPQVIGKVKEYDLCPKCIDRARPDIWPRSLAKEAP